MKDCKRDNFTYEPPRLISFSAEDIVEEVVGPAALAGSFGGMVSRNGEQQL